MNENFPTPQFEERVRKSFGVPEVSAKFTNVVYNHLMQQAEIKSKKPRPFLGLRPAWAITFTVLALLVFGTLVIGPPRVYAAVRQLLGYIPGVGIVDVNAPVRVLAEPVSFTRDGITLEVTSATLTQERTYIEYRLFGVPPEAYPDREDVIGCFDLPYLLLPDGSRLEADAPIPARVDTATYVMPCIFNSLPGTTPTGWELPLSFVTAPPDVLVLPVVEHSPLPGTSLAQDTEAQGEGLTLGASTPETPPVTVSKEIETDDGYILVGSFQPQARPGEEIVVTSTVLTDSSGKEVAYSWPIDVEPEAQSALTGGEGWAMRFKAYGLTYPLTITFSGVGVYEPNPAATATFTFDAGNSPQPGQEWEINQDIQLGGFSFKLLDITANSRGGYSFRLQGEAVYGVSVQIEGFTPNGGGGGGGDQNNGIFSRSLSYSQLPAGNLTLTFSHLTVTGEPLTWLGQWTPANPRTDFPPPEPGMCLDVNILPNLEQIPAKLAGGSALVFEKLEGSELWGLVLYNLDDGSSEVVASGAGWGALSPDRRLVAYSPFSDTPVDIHLFDLNSQTVRTLPGISGTDFHWSPDGQQLAFVASGRGVFVVNADGTDLRQISELNNAAVAGWSPDGNQIFFTAPYTGGAAWKVYVYSLTDGTIAERFNIENGTPKFLSPKLSPDGNWIAYRGQDNSSLYLVRSDGSDSYLVADNTNVVGIEWTRSNWLGLSLRNGNNTESTLVVLKPDSCEAYQASILLNGDLQGFYIP